MAITFIPYMFPGLPGVRCAFQTRVGGVSQGNYGGGNICFFTDDDKATAANRHALREALGVEALAELSQPHADAFVFEPEPTVLDAPSRVEADGQATSRPGLGLMIKTADCQPILLAHTGARHVAAIHAGWRGNRLDFPRTAVERFCAHYGLHPRDLMAVRGPSLGPAMAEFTNYAAEWGREWGRDFSPWFDARARTMDLWSLTRRQLTEAGLAPSRIFGLDMCTATMHDYFFSYRHDKRTGRQAGVIWIAP